MYRASYLAIVLCLVLSHQLSAKDKLTIPEEAAQKKAASQVANLFKAEYDAAKTPEQRLELAKEMLQLGKESTDDPTARFVLIRMARDIAAGAGDVSTALIAISELEASYEVDVLALQADALGKVVKTIRSPEGHQLLATTIQSAFDTAISQDRFSLAKTINDIALDSAQQSRSTELVTGVIAGRKKLAEIEASHQGIQAAVRILEISPTNSDANLLVGRYRCFAKDEWSDGILMLALGSDEKLKKLAEAELAEKPELLELGNAWWDYAGSTLDDSQLAARRRAVYWYRKAAPGLTGITRKVVDQRIVEVDPPQSTRETKERQPRVGDWIIGRFQVSWINLAGNQGRFIVDFHKDNTVQIATSNRETWTIKEDKIRIDYNDPNQGSVIVTVIDKNRFKAEHKPKAGGLSRWTGIRIP